MTTSNTTSNTTLSIPAFDLPVAETISSIAANDDITSNDRKSSGYYADKNAPAFNPADHPPAEFLNLTPPPVVELTGEAIPLNANNKPHHNQYADSDIDYSTMPPPMDGFTDIPPDLTPQPKVVNWINNPKEAYRRNDDGSVVIQDAKGSLKFSCGDYLARNATSPEFIINKIIEKDSHGMLAGASMAFKTFVELAIAHAICNGTYFMGHKVYTSGKVLIICGEGKGALARRLAALHLDISDFNGNLLVLDDNISIDNKEDMDKLKSAINAINPVLVIFDTFASLVSETDENAPCQVAKALRLIKETCRNGYTSSLIVHHHGKDSSKGMRGASNFTNDVDFAFEVTRNPDSMMTTFSCKKMKDGESFADIHMEASVVNLGLIGQDGEESTSLVIKQSDYVPAKKEKSLSSEELKVFSALKQLIENDGLSPPKSIINLFPDNPEYAPKKVVNIEAYRECSFDIITVASETPEKAVLAKKSAFTRYYKKMETLGLIGVHGGFVWLIERKNHTV